jgi:hypothetical protein
MRYTPERYTPEGHAYEGHAYEAHAYEGFYEDLARQITVARLFQRQLGLGSVIHGFLCGRIWVSVTAVVS